MYIIYLSLSISYFLIHRFVSFRHSYVFPVLITISFSAFSLRNLVTGTSLVPLTSTQPHYQRFLRMQYWEGWRWGLCGWVLKNRKRIESPKRKKVKFMTLKISCLYTVHKIINCWALYPWKQKWKKMKKMLSWNVENERRQKLWFIDFRFFFILFNKHLRLLLPCLLFVCVREFSLVSFPPTLSV